MFPPNLLLQPETCVVAFKTGSSQERYIVRYFGPKGLCDRVKIAWILSVEIAWKIKEGREQSSLPFPKQEAKQLLLVYPSAAKSSHTD
jgi:hypothetical protein